MAQADSLLITGRRNFLVRALGFAAAPAAAAVSAVGIPTVSPELIQAVQTWKRSFSDHNAVYETLQYRGPDGRLLNSVHTRPGELSRFGEYYFDLESREREARNVMLRLIIDT